MMDSRWSKIKMNYLMNHKSIFIEWDLSRKPCLSWLIGILWSLKLQSLNASPQCRKLFWSHCFVTPSERYKHSLWCMIYLLGIPVWKQRGTKPWESQTRRSLRWKWYFSFLVTCWYFTALNGSNSSSGFSAFPPNQRGSPPWKQFTPGLTLEGQAWAWRLSRYRQIRNFIQKSTVHFKLQTASSVCLFSIENKSI